MSEYAPVRTITKIEANPALTSRKDEYRRMRVAAYCRVSTDEEDQLNSLDTQVKYYTGKIAENPNWTMVGIYADEGITGTRTDKREKFLKLMRDCEKGKIDLILTKSTTRFARNTVDSLTWIRKLRAMGIGVYFEEQNLDSLKAENETLNSGEVFSLIQSNLSYAVSGNNAALDVFSIEKQMNELKVDIQQMTELAARTEGDPERYEVELKKMFDQLVILRGKLDLAKSQASQSDTVNAEVARIMDILKQTDMNFTEFDDVTVRRLVECIQVCGNKKIIVTLKGGYQAEEELRKIEVA